MVALKFVWSRQEAVADGSYRKAIQSAALPRMRWQRRKPLKKLGLSAKQNDIALGHSPSTGIVAGAKRIAQLMFMR
jgi:hypothetical protein